MSKTKGHVIIQIVGTGGPYPHQCWWRIKGVNGKIFATSELTSFRNAARSIKRVLDAIQAKKILYKVDSKGGKSGSST